MDEISIQLEESNKASFDNKDPEQFNRVIVFLVQKKEDRDKIKNIHA